MVGLHNQGPSINWATVAGIGMLLAVAAAAVGGFVVLQGKSSAIAELDPTNFCPKAGPTAIHAVLIDRTDPLTPLQLEALRQEILHEAQQVAKHEALHVYEVGHGGALLTPVVQVCNPGDGSDASAIDANPGKLRGRYQRLFLAPIDKMLTGMTGDSKMDQSPIMEGIQAIAIKDFGPNGPQGTNTLLIASDFLQHSATFSLYKGVPDVEQFARGPAGRTLQSDLSGVDISLRFLFRARDARFETNTLGPFWVTWLTRQSATVSSSKQLPG